MNIYYTLYFIISMFFITCGSIYLLSEGICNIFRYLECPREYKLWKKVYKNIDTFEIKETGIFGNNIYASLVSSEFKGKELLIWGCTKDCSMMDRENEKCILSNYYYEMSNKCYNYLVNKYNLKNGDDLAFDS